MNRIPPDPEGLNEFRARWAGEALAAFQLASGADENDALPNLLAALLHWADRNVHSFDGALVRARACYESDIEEGL